jgi:hypothetical protein
MAASVARALAAVVLTLMAWAPANADDAALRRELTATLDAFYVASRQGDIDAAMAIQPPLRAMYDDAIREKMPPAEVRRRMTEFLKSSAPESYEVLYSVVSKDGGDATLIVNGKPPRSANPQGPGVGEVEYGFKRDSDRWTIEQALASPDPATIKQPPEDAFEPEDAYTGDMNTSLGGRIRGLRFADDHTLIVVRVLDEDQLAYLPPATKLREAGFNPDSLRLFRIVSIEGIRHPTKDYKVWATGLDILE